MNEIKARIRALNDDLRRQHKGGCVILTAGVQALDDRTLRRIDLAIAKFSDFNHGNDPHDEYDFGVVYVADETVFFKIDYYDLDLSSHSPDPADPDVTRRVMTIMLAEEC